MKSSALLLQNFSTSRMCKWSRRPSQTIELLYSANHRTPGYKPSILDSEGRKAAPVAIAIRFTSAFLHLLTAMALASTKYYKHQTNQHLNEKHKYKHFELSTSIIVVFDIIKQTPCLHARILALCIHFLTSLLLSNTYSICNRSDLPSNNDHQSHQYIESHLLLLPGFSVSSPSKCLILVL
jgi:hypothetical protein